MDNSKKTLQLFVVILLNVFLFAFFASTYAYGEPPENSEPPVDEVILAAAGDDPEDVGDFAFPPPAAENFIFTGSASYAFPIRVPPGRNGIEPQLTITYNSQRRTGWMGAGWDIPMGFIQRSTKWGLNYTSNEYVAVEKGSQIELTPRQGVGDWGVNYYGAKAEKAFSKYYYNTSTKGWEVTAKNGTKYYYGSATASRQDFATDGSKTFRWCLDKVLDTNGNYMTVSYYKDQGQIYLDEIKYTYDGANPRYRVVFERELWLGDDAPLYTTNYSVKTVYRLKAVKVYHLPPSMPEQLVRKYELVYTPSNNSSHVLLASITEFGSDNITFLPQTLFTYQQPQNDFYKLNSSIPAWPTELYNGGSRFTVAGDFNGDGRTDLVSWMNSSQIRMHLSTGSGFDIQYWNGQFYLDADAKPRLWVGDFNGDGKADLISVQNNGTIIVHLTNSDGSGFLSPLSWGTGANNGGTKYSRVGDFNGDGKADFMSWKDGSLGKKVKMYLSTGSGFTSSEWTSSFDKNADGPLLWVGDFNGDGKTDVAGWKSASTVRVHISNGASFTWTDWAANLFNDPTFGPLLWVGDFNGDGKADIAGWKNGSSMAIHISTGSAFQTSTWLADVYKDTVKGPRIWPGDFNGDGRTDIAALVQLQGGEKILMHLSNGDSFASSQWVSEVDTGRLNWVGDFNGDGRTDIASKTDGSNVLRMNMPEGDFPELLSSVRNGIGANSLITYQPSSVYPNRRLPFVIQTVSAIDVHDGNDITATTTYDYANGHYNAADREFYGFGYVMQTDAPADPVSGATLETWFHQEQGTGVLSRYKQLPLAETIKNLTGSLYKDVRYAYSYTQPVSGVNFPFLTTKSDILYDGQPVSTTVQTRFAYDSYGNITQKLLDGDLSVAGDERYEYTEYAPCNVSKWIVDKPSRAYVTDSGYNLKAQSWYEYDAGTCAKGNLTKKTDWLNGGTNPVTEYSYNSYGNRTSVEDPKNITTTTTYDTTTSTYPQTVTLSDLSYYTEKTYDLRYGKPLTERDYNGNITTYTYDPFGRIASVTQPPDITYPTKEYQYQNFGTVGNQRVRVLLRKEPGVAYYTWKENYFDGLGRIFLTKKEGPSVVAVIISSVYDQRGLLAARSLPYFEGATTYWTTYQYDPLKRVFLTTKPNGIYQTAYDRGRTTQIDPNGHAKVTETDGLGRLVAAEEYSGTAYPYTLYATTTYQYDPLGNLRFVTDDAGNLTTMEYDTLSRKVSMTDPDMGTWHYAYDANGNLTSQTDAMNQTITFSYFNPQIGKEDPLNRLHTKDYPSGTDTVYTYDQGLASDNPKGRLTSVTDAAATSQLYYDQRGNTKRKTITPVNGTPRTIDTTYDSQNRIKNLTYPDGEVLTYLYNPPGGITAIQSSLVPDYVTMEDYDAPGQPWTISYGNGVSSVYTFNLPTNRLASLVTGNLQNLAYAYDPVGNILNIADAVQSSRSQTFTYDHLNRLDTAYSEAYDPIGGSDTIDYAYNEIGNMTLNSRLGTYQYTNPSHVHAATQAGSNSYQYNANGNMTGGEGGNLSMSWNYDNKPATLQRGGTAISLLYDYTGHRVKKTVGSTSTVYIDKLYECAGTACKKHIFADSRRVATRTPTDTLYYHPDHLGSSAIVTNSSGIKAKEIYYYPYGETRTESGSADIKHKFTGQELDNETGIYNYKARYYHPVIGRFISPDSIVPDPADPQSLNRYSYALNNSVTYVDPTGHKVIIAGHVAAWGAGYIYNPFLPAYHLSVVLFPDRPQDFTNRTGWTTMPDGAISATLGAQPRGNATPLNLLGNVRSVPNNPSDMPQPGGWSQEIATPKGMTDTQAINRLITAASTYDNGLPYEPDPKWTSSGYNSNSYVSGLFWTALGYAPVIDTGGSFQVPGYDQPMPMYPQPEPMPLYPPYDEFPLYNIPFLFW